tara:strand:+ start:272 stop:1063 length:792 start_codon:yes stop_codon:yes gene_type:complete
MNKKKIKIKKILKKNRPIVCLTANNVYTAKILDGICDIVLTGDSLGMVVYGYNTTRNVSLEMIINHAKAVGTVIKKSIFVVDMPKGTYEKSIKTAVKNAKRIIKSSGCDAVKLEGGVKVSKIIKGLVKKNISVMGHIGLQPQAISNPKKFKVIGKSNHQIKKVLHDLKSIESAGAFAVVLETVTEKLANTICKVAKIPVIGIGASNKCDGQILVTEDLLGLFDKTAKFVKKYDNLNLRIKRAVKNYFSDVIRRKFPSKKYIYK